MRNYTGSKRVRNAVEDAREAPAAFKRIARHTERRALRDDTARMVEEFFEDQIEDAIEDAIELAEIWDDIFDGQSRYFEEGVWIEERGLY